MNLLYRLEGAGVRYGSARVLQDVSIEFAAGEFVALAGPNGAGKSTLLTLLAGLQAPSDGTCLFRGRAAHRWPRREFAGRVAVVRQTESAAFPFTAEEVVYMGRMPHSRGFRETAADHGAVSHALELTGMASFRKRDFRTLSGGERQRILVAAALAQTPEILLLDEPANHLDLHHQIGLHRILRDLSREGMLVVAATHDLNLAAAYASRVVLLSSGRLCESGTPAQVLRAETIEQVFQVHATLHRTATGNPWVLYGE